MPPAPDASPSPASNPIKRSRLFYERAIFTGDPAALAEAHRELGAVEADLAVACGRVLHGTFIAARASDPDHATPDPQALTLFERAAQLYQQHGAPAAKAAPSSGPAAITRSRTATTPPPSRSWTAP
ncbi:MAG: hypothetical protein ABJB47_02065 [Actinomycetota bacterium]